MRAKLGNVEFGGNSGDLIITDFSPPSTELRTNMTDRPNGDGVMVGEDRLGASTWGFDISTNTSNLREAAKAVASLEGEWKKPSSRLTANVPVPLQYSLDGANWYRVYGRPGKFTGMSPNVLARLGVGMATADFTQTIPLHFSDGEHVEILTITQPSYGGLTSPLVAPLTTVGTGAERAGLVTNEGDAPTPLKVVFKGPITNPVIRSAKGWEIGYRGTIQYDESVTIDPLLGTVKKNNGSSVAGNLTVKTRLSAVTMPAGQSEYFFSGTDQTGTAKVELRWRDAYTAMQY